MSDNRRKTERRHDPDAWSPGHRRMVKAVFGLVVGGSLIMASVVLLFWAIINDRVEWPVLAACLFVMVMGLIAGMPGVFMPVFSAMLKKLPIGRANGGDITRALQSVKDDDEL